jgi:hypothetical protein
MMPYQMATLSRDDQGGDVGAPRACGRQMLRSNPKALILSATAMKMVGHKAEAIHRRRAIVDTGALRDAATRIDRAARA